MKPGKDKWIANVMNSLEGIQSAKADSALYQKVKNRIDSGEFQPSQETVSTATVWRMAAALFLIAALNAGTCLAISRNNPNSKRSELRNFAHEYSLVTDTYNY